MNFKERLDDAFEEMMSYRRSVGYATVTYRSSIPPFIVHCTNGHPDAAYITPDMVNKWFAFYPYFNNSKAAFISLPREYTRYLNFLGYEDFIPDDDYVVKRTAFNLYLFTDDEMCILFTTIDSYVGATCGKQYFPEVVLPVYTRMLYCCGLRPQGPPAIRTEDLDLDIGDLYIRQSKRHKDRYIIMSDDMLDFCRRYDGTVEKREWFFQKWDGTRYETSWYNEISRILLRCNYAWCDIYGT